MSQIDLLEGERYPEKPVQCSSFGNPTPSYYWTFSSALQPHHHNHHKNNNNNHHHRGGGDSVSNNGESSFVDGVSSNNNNLNIMNFHVDEPVVAIGPMLTLNITTTTTNHQQQLLKILQQQQQYDLSSSSHYSHQAETSISDSGGIITSSSSSLFGYSGMIIGLGVPPQPSAATMSPIMSTTAPSLFRASRTQSGNYTCVATNRHGTYSATMTINVFCKYISVKIYFYLLLPLRIY